MRVPQAGGRDTCPAPPEHRRLWRLDTYTCHEPDTGWMRLQSRSAYRVFEIVQDIRELAEALGHPKFVLVAHDWGAVAAWQFAAYHQVH